MKDKTPRNSEGLTFDEWVRAANHCRTTSLPTALALRAWQAGDDPSDFAYMHILQKLIQTGGGEAYIARPFDPAKGKNDLTVYLSSEKVGLLIAHIVFYAKEANLSIEEYQGLCGALAHMHIIRAKSGGRCVGVYFSGTEYTPPTPKAHVCFIAHVYGYALEAPISASGPTIEAALHACREKLPNPSRCWELTYSPASMQLYQNGKCVGCIEQHVE